MRSRPSPRPGTWKDVSRMTDAVGARAPEEIAVLIESLPAKPRVHGLAKVAGVASKEIIALLAERGVTVSSASSSVDRHLAVQLLTELLGVADGGDHAGPEAGFTSAVVMPDSGAPPAVTKPPRRRKKTAIGEPDTPLFAAPVFEEPAFESGDQPSPAAPVAEKSADAKPARRSRKKSASSDQAEPVIAEPAADLAPDEDVDSDQGQDGRRRRRRGRRGRGRTAEDETTADTETDDQPPAAEQPEEGAQESDEEAGTSSRRRRRRRRRSGNDDGSEVSTDDGDGSVTTTVHVRDSRQAAAAVQGIKGSTRLEAKRQRRRDSREQRRRPQILTEAEFLARRESVKRVMAVRQRGGTSQVALLEDGILVEHFVSNSGAASLIGNVYLGKVQNVLPSMEAAFVDIGRGRNAVLYAGEVNWDITGLEGKARRIETALSSGDTVLVQVSKDPVGHKGARLTTQISLPGRFLVYVPGGGATGISRKLPDTERKRLKGILDRLVPEGAGVIIRTAAEGVDEQELTQDVQRLTKQWAEIERKAERQANAPTLLSAEPDTLIRVIRDLFNSDISELVIDGQDAYPAVAEYVTAVAPELADRLSEYDGSSDVFAAYRVDEQISKALERKVHLPSGGSLVIDRTEAMTVVDVNTGKFTGSGGNLEETVTKNNLEAAEEIVRQLRLRDIGGIIVVDFIDMVLEANRDLVLRRLTECLGRDRTRHQVAEVTSLGLVQMTRKRLGTGLVEAFSEPCEACHGRGIVLGDLPSSPSNPAESSESGRKGRRRAKRGASAAEVPIVRIETPPGVKPVLRPGAPIRANGEVSATASADVTAAAVGAEAAVDALAEPFGEVEMPAKRPRRRRAAARPAGAPVAENAAVVPAIEVDGDAGVTDMSAAASVDLPAAVEGSAPKRRPRRRAASRPAGPAAGN